MINSILVGEDNVVTFAYIPRTHQLHVSLNGHLIYKVDRQRGFYVPCVVWKDNGVGKVHLKASGLVARPLAVPPQIELPRKLHCVSKYAATVADIFGDNDPITIGAKLDVAEMMAHQNNESKGLEIVLGVIAALSATQTSPAEPILVPIEIVTKALFVLGIVFERRREFWKGKELFTLALSLWR